MAGLAITTPIESENKMDATTITYKWDLKEGFSRMKGYKQQMIRIEEILSVMYYEAEENFTFQHANDPYYNDTTTDYLLGKRDAITQVLAHVRKEIAETL